MVVGHFSQAVQPQLAWLAVASLCLTSWFSSSILEMVLRTASLAYPGQGTKELGSLVHGYRGHNAHVRLHDGRGGADSAVHQDFTPELFLL